MIIYRSMQNESNTPMYLIERVRKHFSIKLDGGICDTTAPPPPPPPPAKPPPLKLTGE